MLDAADVLLGLAHLPGDLQIGFEEAGLYARSQDGREPGDSASEFVQNGNHLGGMAEPVAGDRAPDFFHTHDAFTRGFPPFAILSSASMINPGWLPWGSTPSISFRTSWIGPWGAGSSRSN